MGFTGLAVFDTRSKYKKKKEQEKIFLPLVGVECNYYLVFDQKEDLWNKFQYFLRAFLIFPDHWCI